MNSFPHNRASAYAQFLLNMLDRGDSGQIEFAVMHVVTARNPSQTHESERLEVVKAVAQLFQSSRKQGISETDLCVGLDMLRHIVFGSHVLEPATTDVRIESPASYPN